MKLTRTLLAPFFISGLLLSNVSCAADADNNNGPDAKELEKYWAPVLEGSKITAVKPSPIKGLWEIQTGPHIFYTNESGDKIIIGDLISMENDAPVSLTETGREAARIAAIKELHPKDFIIYPAKKAKHNIYVFTDADCVYCRKFHAQRKELTDAGITVNYLAMPRTPPGSPSYTKAIAIWCSKDRQTAFDAAVEEEFKDADKTCEAGEKIVDRDVALARSFGANGTPTIILESGERIPGFIPAPELIKYLSDEEKAESQ